MRYLVLFLALFLIVSCDESNSDDNDCNCADNQICNADKVCVDKVVCDCTETQYCNADNVCVDKAVCEDTQFATNSGTCVDKLCADATSCKTGMLGEDCYAGDTCDSGFLCYNGVCNEKSEDGKSQLQPNGLVLLGNDIEDYFTFSDFVIDDDEVTTYGMIHVKYSPRGEKLSVGDVISFPPASMIENIVANYPFINSGQVKVTGVTYTDSDIVLSVEKSSSLLELYQDLTTKGMLVSDDNVTPSPSMNGVLFDRRATDYDGTISVMDPFGDKVSKEWSGEYEYGSWSLKTFLEAQFTPTIDYDIYVSSRPFTTNKVIITPKFTSTLTFDVTFEGKVGREWPFTLMPQKSVGTYPIFTGVYITPKVGLSAKVTANLEGTINYNQVLTHVLKVGIDYLEDRSPEVKGINSSTFTDVQTGKFDAKATLDILLPEVNITFLINGVLGLDFNVGLITTFTAEASGGTAFLPGTSNVSLTLGIKAGITANAGIHLEIWGHTLGELKSDTYTHQWNIWSHTWEYTECKEDKDCKGVDDDAFCQMEKPNDTDGRCVTSVCPKCTREKGNAYIDECNTDDKVCKLKDGKCSEHADCDDNQFCNWSGTCADPCVSTSNGGCTQTEKNNGATCFAENHQGVCACPEGKEGDPEVMQCQDECAKVGANEDAKAPMCDIAGGTYSMGCIPGDTLCEGYESPVHSVTVANFKLDQYEVTVAAYKKCVAAGDCNASDHVLKVDQNNCNYYNDNSDKKPMNCITWEGAKDFCEWNGKSLPTEEQWEYAARGGAANHVYPFVTLPAEDEAVCSVAVHSSSQNKCNPGETKNVGQFGKDVSVIGAARIHDMAGNVSEWTNDRYSEETYSQGSNAGSICSEQQVIDGNCDYKMHIYRGGAFNSTEVKVLRSTFRNWEKIDGVSVDSNSKELSNYMPAVGFRCAQ